MVDTIDKPKGEENLEDFHIVWYPDKNSIYSTGMDVKAETMVKALQDFITEHGINPLYIMSKAAFERKDNHEELEKDVQSLPKTM